MEKKTQEVPASELSTKPVMANIDPVMTTQRVEKRLAKALESGPGDNSDCLLMANGTSQHAGTVKDRKSV